MKPNEAALPALAGATGSVERCHNCDYWEPQTYQGQGPSRQVANVGYCPVFHKQTVPEHGSECTAWNPQNTKLSGGEQTQP